MLRRGLLVALSVIGGSVLAVGTAHADQPDRFEYEFFEEFVDTEVCAAEPWQFDVHATEHGYGFVEIFFDADGNFVRGIDHLNLDFTISANGITLTERDQINTFFDADGFAETLACGRTSRARTEASSSSTPASWCSMPTATSCAPLAATRSSSARASAMPSCRQADETTRPAAIPKAQPKSLRGNPPGELAFGGWPCGRLTAFYGLPAGTVLATPKPAHGGDPATGSPLQVLVAGDNSQLAPRALR